MSSVKEKWSAMPKDEFGLRERVAVHIVDMVPEDEGTNDTAIGHSIDLATVLAGHLPDSAHTQSGIWILLYSNDEI